MAVETITGNQDVDYIVKDFNSSVDSLISFANVNFGPGTSANRLWTNFNADSFSRTWLEIVALISDVLFFYFDTQATQSYLQTATIRSAVRDIASQFGFEPATAQSASGDATFTFTGAGTIPRGFRVSSNSGIEYFVTSPITAGAAGDFTGTVLQGAIQTENLSAQGLQNEEFDLIGPNVIVDRDNSNPNDVTPQVTVNGNSYTLVESFLRFDGTDSDPVSDSLGNVIGGGGRVFTLHERSSGTPFIRFGDGINGRKLTSGDTIIVTYRTGGGSQGNIAEGSLTTLVDTLSFVSGVTNNDDFSGGADEQSIDQLKELIPASLRTLERAVSQLDYSDLILANFNEVFAASTEVNKTDPGVDLNIYVVPQGSGIPQITTNTLLLNQLNDFIDRRKMVTVQFQIADAFPLDILISLEVFVTNSASRSTVTEAIQTALVNFFNLSTGGSDESGINFAENILLRNINSIISGISGVERFEITQLSYRPRISFNTQGLATDYNTSEVSIFEPVSEVEWLVAASGESAEVVGDVVFNNPDSVGFTYDSATGKIQYQFPVDLSTVAPGDSFRNGPGLEEITVVKTRDDGVGTQEVTKVTTVADQQGISEETDILTVADVSGSLGGTFFIIYDTVGSVAVWYNVDSGNTEPSSGANRSIEVSISSDDDANTVALNTAIALNNDLEFTASNNLFIVTVTLDDPASVADTADGSIPTGFTFTTTIDGENPDTLDGSFFDIEDDTGPVRVWIDVDNSSSAPSVPAGGRLLEVDISANDSANNVASQLQSVVDSDSKFSASVSLDVVTITDASAGQRTDVQEGSIPTGFDFEIDQQGANPDTLDGKYFDMYDSAGPVRVWFDVDNTSAAPSVPGSGRLLEVDISSGDVANDVASALQSAVDLDSEFSASVSANEVTITADGVGTRVDAEDVDTGFTITVDTQGVGNDVDFEILSVDDDTSSLFIAKDQLVNAVGASGAGGSIRNGSTTFESFTVFKKILATATNLSLNSITDTNLDLSVKQGTGSALEARLLLDNNQVFVPNAYATGNFFLVDGAGNIWEIEENTSNTIFTGVTAVNDASITNVSDGDYKIVKRLTGSQVVFNDSVFNIQYNSENTIFSVGSQFTQIGTIGDDFEISTEQTNQGSLGVAVDPISFEADDGSIRLNAAPDLEGLSSENVLIDSSGQIFNIIGVDNRPLTSVFYSDSNQDTELLLEDSGLDSQFAMGFQVSETETYSVVSFYLKKEGNIIGNLTARIVEDDGSGLPDLSSTVAISRSLNVSSLSDSSFEKTVFSFQIPPTLSKGTQYHLVLSGDSAYSSAQQDEVTIFNNSGAVSYTYDALTGLVQYGGSVVLSDVLPGHFFEDGSGALFSILSVDDTNDTITLTTGLTVDDSSGGDVIAKDNVYLGADSSSPNYVDGEMSRFNGTSWSNSSSGSDQFSLEHDAIFTVEGPKSIKIDSNLTPVLGEGATISQRYYDDNDEISFVLGISSGVITSAADVDATAKGTVAGSPNSSVDNFVFRTSSFADDVVNLRLNEIPRISTDDIKISIFGGVQ